MIPIKRSPTLDAVRGIAILLVVIWHYFHTAPHGIKIPPSNIFLVNLTWSGVDLFFVLSGFLIGGILIDNRSATRYFSVFYIRRCARILPLYFVAVAFILSFMAPHQSFLAYLTFTQNITWGIAGFPLTSDVTWSLCVEEQFYLLVPLLIWIIPTKRLPYVLIALAALAPPIRIFLRETLNPLAAYAMMPARMDSLFLGVLIAWSIRQKNIKAWLGEHRSTLAVPLLLAGGALLLLSGSDQDAFSWHMQAYGYSLIALFYGLVLAWLVSANIDFASSRILQWLGLGAYSIYLFHLTFLLIAEHLMLGSFAPFVAALTTALFATISWQWLEKPLIRQCRSYWTYENDRCTLSETAESCARVGSSPVVDPHS
jgi:peptidoglycan/LPS O-acetylase OafA/YrhL